MKTVVLATGNTHKLEEFRRFFRELDVPIELLSMREAGFTGEIVENGDRFEINAYLKARAVISATGLPCIADDSGLEVDALGGAPGIYSARYAGVHGDDEANIRRLLEEMKDVPEEKRTARFVCVMCVLKPRAEGGDPETMLIRETVEGKILREKRGSGTFGYDPIFLYEPLGKTFAELDGNTKNQISHRGRALEKLLQQLNFLLK